MNSGLAWTNVSVSLDAKKLLDDVAGFAPAGKVTALMGPSGSGKTTLLSVLSQRLDGFEKFKIDGDITFHGTAVTKNLLRKISRFVQQEDHLLRCLTARESVDFSVKMSGQVPNEERAALVERTLDFFGLSKQQDTIVGTPLQKGLSGGQRRRLSVAEQIVTKPEILFLDEPTSGLDSAASFAVTQLLQKFARVENVTVIASIHQPSTSTFNLFDNVVFLSEGKIVYSGPRKSLDSYFERAQFPIPAHFNPAEFILDLINVDFASNSTEGRENLERLIQFAKSESKPLDDYSDKPTSDAYSEDEIISLNELTKIGYLLQRGMKKAYRDYLAYYVRMAMYFGLAIMMGTVWLRLSYNQANIQLFINAIFFSGAFMSFMSVAYIPAYLEDYNAYKKEKSNGLYGSFSFMVANFVTGAPFLFLIVVMFSIITYFMCHFKESANGFFMYVLYLFINLLAAESLTIFIATAFPIFVVALALTAFANGLWMAVGGFLVSASVLNVFWYYTFYWIDYQRYAFQGMMFNQFRTTIYDCGSGCQCMYTSALQDQCKIEGSAVLESLGYGQSDHRLWIGIMIVLIFVLRLLTYLVLKFRK